MRKAITILLLAFMCLSVQAQRHKVDWPSVGLSVGGSLLSIACEMSGDALLDMGKANNNQTQKYAGHSLQVIGYVAPIVTTTLLVVRNYDEKRVWEMLTVQLVTYGTMRYAWGDGVYNMVHPDYGFLDVGTTSKYDEVMSGMPPDGRAFTKFISFGLGVSINIKYW